MKRICKNARRETIQFNIDEIKNLIDCYAEERILYIKQIIKLEKDIYALIVKRKSLETLIKTKK